MFDSIYDISEVIESISLDSGCVGASDNHIRRANEAPSMII